MKIAMIILAAGYSKRMGVLKPLLPVGNESALLRTVSLARHKNIHVITVVTGNRHEDVEAELMRSHAKNIRHIYNGKFAEGMFSSVKAGIHSLPSDVDGFFLLPVDHCAVQPDTLEKLIASFILAEGQTIIYPSYNGKRGHPPLIPIGFVFGVTDYDGPDGMQGYLSGFPADEVETEDPGVLLDMDTPVDYAALLAHLDLPTYPDENECLRLLNQYETPKNILQHARQVCDLAIKIADLLIEKGVFLNKPLLSSACLLHDILRLDSDHAHAGAKRLLSLGYPDTAMLIENHMELPPGHVIKADELSLLYLSDKLSRNGALIAPENTLRSLRERFTGNAEAYDKAVERMAQAEAILALLKSQYGIAQADLLPHS